MNTKHNGSQAANGHHGRAPGPLLEEDRRRGHGSSAIMFLTATDFERGLDLLLDQGPVTALPNFVFLCDDEELASVSRRLRASRVGFATRHDLPPVLTDEAADALAASKGWILSNGDSAGTLRRLARSMADVGRKAR